MKFENIDELLDYSEKIIGKTLNDIVRENEEFEDSHTMKTTKGILGNLIETEFYHYPNNNSAEADFENLGVELKVTGIVKKSNGIRAKERLVLSMINYDEIVYEEYEDSHLVKKSSILLILFYCYRQGIDFKDFKFITLMLYYLDRDKEIIKNDYNIIRQKVLEGKAHELSEGDTAYLGACTKGSKKYNSRSQPFSDIPARSRAFCLKNKYMNLIVTELLENGLPAKNKKTEYLSVLDYINEKMNPYFGKTQIQIADEIGIKYTENALPKNLNKMISDKIIGKDEDLDDVNEIFKYSSYIIKNSPIIKNRGYKERMTFRNLKISDFNESWDDSVWKQYFEETSIINILYEFEDSKSKLGEGVLKEVKNLTFNADDIDAMEKSFNMIKHAIECYNKRTYGENLDEYVKLLPTPKSYKNQILEISPKRSKGKKSYNSLFENESDRTYVTFVLTKDFLSRKLRSN